MGQTFHRPSWAIYIQAQKRSQGVVIFLDDV